MDQINSLEQDLAAKQSREQAWLQFFHGPAHQTPPIQARVVEGPSLCVPRQFMAVPQITSPKPGTGEFIIILALFSLKQ